jgi:hypothetical protein
LRTKAREKGKIIIIRKIVSSLILFNIIKPAIIPIWSYIYPSINVEIMKFFPKMMAIKNKNEHEYLLNMINIIQKPYKPDKFGFHLTIRVYVASSICRDFDRQ